MPFFDEGKEITQKVKEAFSRLVQEIYLLSILGKPQKNNGLFLVARGAWPHRIMPFFEALKKIRAGTLKKDRNFVCGFPTLYPNLRHVVFFLPSRNYPVIRKTF